MTLCIIPARGGSKRIPRKNIKPFNGKPVMAYSIEAALESGCFAHVAVSTDDAEIAAVARQYGAETPFERPPELANDFATTGAVMRHAVAMLLADGLPESGLSHFSGSLRSPLPEVCCLYATAPFVRPADLQRGLETLRQSGGDYAFSVTDFPFPIQRALRLNGQGRVSMFQPENFAVRSQDLEPAWHDAGQFYWGSAEAWLAEKPIFNSRAAAVKLPRYRVQDIDTPEDWARAEIMWRVLQEQGE
ncbi:pseudaminic acid cytidylyltransferase [Eikenella sp. S3360]|uniref:Pseudaminic acid cytidylyltransferase n=1 Tax=Eikenella glucosivorans TaxID=2766967 RepID=A0ABS0NC95_9NEIS|nr:pseudaminic acid cytidylyltransferase [Eikenella glucosivorans]